MKEKSLPYTFAAKSVDKRGKGPEERHFAELSLTLCYANMSFDKRMLQMLR